MLKDFVASSHQFSGPLHVQGGGGNTSVKISESEMVIKASGTFLKEMTEGKPGVKLDPSVIIDRLEKGDIKAVNQEQEDEMNALIDANTDHAFFPDKKASIETSVHAIIPRKYVFHTHFVYANVFLTAEEGWEVLMSMFGDDIGLIGYRSPGLGLTLEIWNQYPDRTQIPPILCFDSHGITFSGDTLEEVVGLYQSVHEVLAGYLAQKGLESFEAKDLKNSYGSWVPGYYLQGAIEGQKVVRHLFPDSVVFGQDLNADIDEKGITFRGDSVRKNTTVWENLAAMNYLQYAHQALGWTSKYLESSDENYILDMSREKYRIKLNK